MKAVVKEEKGVGFKIKEVDYPKLGPEEVIIQVKCVGICGTDIPIYEGVREVPLPLIPGHEFSGVIVEKGKDVKEFEIGDRVSARLVISCDRCSFCKNGYESLCEDIVEIGIDINGAFAEYVAVPYKVVHHLPEKLSFEDGASIDPIASAYRFIRKVSVTTADAVVIIGPGPIGLYALQIAVAEGAKKAIIVGAKGDESRLEVAKDLGASKTVNICQEDALEKIKEYTNGTMADVVVEATGNPAAVDFALNSAKKGGRVVLGGIFHKLSEIEPGKIVRKELKVFGSFCYSSTDFSECIELLLNKKVETARIITHILPLEKIEEGIKLVKRKEAIKVILKPGGS